MATKPSVVFCHGIWADDGYEKASNDPVSAGEPEPTLLVIR
jgi:hypothetical protein